MGLLEDLQKKVSNFAKEKYEIEGTTMIPSNTYSKLTFGNKGLTCFYAFLFVDIRESSKLVQKYGYSKAAKIYQSFHEICLRIIEDNNGKVKAFDGDRIMGVFVGDTKRSEAVKAALQIQSGIRDILNPTLSTSIKCGAGVDCGEILITKVGKGGESTNNDLVWIGKASNYSSHLANEALNSTIISESTYEKMSSSSTFSGDEDMWKKISVILKNDIKVTCYESSWSWQI